MKQCKTKVFPDEKNKSVNACTGAVIAFPDL